MTMTTTKPTENSREAAVESSAKTSKDGSKKSARSLMEENAKRCQEIAHCQAQVRYWKDRLNKLEAEHRKQRLLTRVRLEADAFWPLLSSKQQKSKEFVLAALQSDSRLERFKERIPKRLLHDRQVLLAIIQRDDFASYYSSMVRNPFSAGPKFLVPKKLSNDKQVFLAILQKAPRELQMASDELRDDDEIFNHMLQQCPTKKSQMICLQFFSQRIRSDFKLMSQVLKSPHGVHAIAYMDSSLMTRKDFVLQLFVTTHNFRKSTSSSKTQGERPLRLANVLKRVSKRLRDDYDVVLAAVKYNGMNLQHASARLRRNETIVRAACVEEAFFDHPDKTPFTYCLASSTRKRLRRDRQFLLKLMTECHRNQVAPAAAKLWRHVCPPEFQNQREFLLTAMGAGGYLTYDDVGPLWQTDADFLKQAVRKNPIFYMSIPLSLKQGQQELAIVAIESASHTEGHQYCLEDIVVQALDMVPELFSHRPTMMTIVQHWPFDLFLRTLQYSSLDIRNDKELMMKAVQVHGGCLEFCSEELVQDMDILMAAVERTPSVLNLAPLWIQRSNPELIVAAIRKCHPEYLWDIYEAILDDQVWTNRDVALAWISRGGDFLDEFEDVFQDDAEFFLQVAQHCWPNLMMASARLRNNREFMMQACELDGRVILFATRASGAAENFELWVTAFAHSPNAAQPFSEDFDFMMELSGLIQQRLKLQESYMKSVLCSIHRRTATTSAHQDGTTALCHLPLLNQGPDTSLVYKQLIADYVGIPRGSELSRLRKAAANLALWGY